MFIREPTISLVNIICDTRLYIGFTLVYVQELKGYFSVGRGSFCGNGWISEITIVTQGNHGSWLDRMRVRIPYSDIGH